MKTTLPPSLFRQMPILSFWDWMNLRLDQYTNNLKDSNGQIVFSCAPIKGLPSVSSTKLLNSPKFDPHESFPNVTDSDFWQWGKRRADDVRVSAGLCLFMG